MATMLHNAASYGYGVTKQNYNILLTQDKTSCERISLMH